MGMRMDGNMGIAEQLLYQARFDTEQNKLCQKICWKRCVEGLAASMSDTSDEAVALLPEPTKLCLDMCAPKLVETAALVSMKTQEWQMEEARTQAAQRIVRRAFWGVAAIGAATG